jgi:hypothetical protein
MRKWIVLAGVLIACAAAFVAARLHLPTLIGIGPGYSAEIVCACVFVSGRTAESCASDMDSLARKLVSVSVASASRSVTARSLGLVQRTAHYREGYGCTLDE